MKAKELKNYLDKLSDEDLERELILFNDESTQFFSIDTIELHEDEYLKELTIFIEEIIE